MHKLKAETIKTEKNDTPSQLSQTSHVNLLAHALPM